MSRPAILIVRSLIYPCAAIYACAALTLAQAPPETVDTPRDAYQSADRYAAPDVISAESLRVPKRTAVENEAAVINVCASYVEGQMIYFHSFRDPQGFLGFASRIHSTPAMHDGLYWPVDSGEDESPMGPQFAAAAFTEAPSGISRPYFGYYFKILYAQGPDALGGARDYRVDGRLVTGFALIAWPAEYGASGVHSFVVNHLGDVYSKDLGPNTDRDAIGMSAFSPDRTWTRVLAAVETR